MSEPLAIAQVVSAPWGSDDTAVGQARLIAAGLAARGHRVTVLAPARNATEAAEGRRAIQAARNDGANMLPEPDGEPLVIAVGEALPVAGSRRSLPTGTARLIGDLLEVAPFDVVHLHDPLPPSLAAIALRNSRALNLGHFHQPIPKIPAGDVGRRVGGAVLGRIDDCIADFEAAAVTVRASVPVGCETVARAALRSASGADGNETADVVIAQVIGSERGSLRNTLRALKRLPGEGWRAKIALTPGTPHPTAIAPAIRDRIEIVDLDGGGEAAFLHGADLVVVGGGASAVRPQALIEAVAAGAVPVASSLPVHEELLSDGALGPGFTPGDAETLAAQLRTLIEQPRRREAFVGAAEPLRSELKAERLVDEIERRCLALVARRHDTRAKPKIAARLADRPLIEVDLHMHTDHSHDCATPVEVLLTQARARGLGAIAVTDHNEVSGALEARAKASGIKVIVGEEVKTKNQGEVIGLFIEKRIPAGMSFEETLDAIHAQGGIAYVPHPFDRMHSVPDYEHLLACVDRIDALEVYNARVAIGEFNEEAARFAAKYRIPAGAGSDAHVAQGLGSVKIRMRDFDGPEEFLESLREADIVRSPSSLLFVQALKFVQTKATPSGARDAVKRRRVKRASRKS
ncbi:MAG: PHP-associated domain-containing protein [Actinomycetes bacterium]